jgi:hypothetical protein
MIILMLANSPNLFTGYTQVQNETVKVVCEAMPYYDYTLFTILGQVEILLIFEIKKIHSKPINTKQFGLSYIYR